jgi:hypothetical protein
MNRFSDALNGHFGSFVSAALPATAETSAPAASPSAAAANQPDEEEKQERANRGVENRSDDPRTEMNAKLRQQHSADKGACDADDHIARETQANALHEMARKPAGDDPDQKQDE